MVHPHLTHLQVPYFRLVWTEVLIIMFLSFRILPYRVSGEEHYGSFYLTALSTG